MKLCCVIALAIVSVIGGCSPNSALFANDASNDASVDAPGAVDAAFDAIADTDAADADTGDADSREGDVTADVSDDGVGNDGGSCAGEIEFTLEAPDPSVWFAMESERDCGPEEWLYIYDHTGAEVQIGHPTSHCCSMVSCDSCQFDVLCPASFSQEALPMTRTWDASVFLPGTCGSDSRACLMKSSCAPSGHYVARMCGHRRADANSYVCVDVPFEVPAPVAVVGMLPN